MKLDDARVLVTGGGTGIGLATARLLAARGAKVAICGRRRDVLDTAAASFGGVAVTGDVSREDDVRVIVSEAVAALGGFNVLVNNAAYGYLRPLVEIELAPFERQMAVNLTGAMLMAREAARHFIPQRTGHIVNVGSTAASRGFAGGTAYVASKFALRGMTECWRAELRTHNIRVSLVHPSEVLTDFYQTAGMPQAASDRKLRADEIAHLIAGTLELDDRGFVTELTVWATNPDS